MPGPDSAWRFHPDSGLIPPLGSSRRALVYQWVLFGMTELEAPLFRWLRELADESAESPSRERFAQAAAPLVPGHCPRSWGEVVPPLAVSREPAHAQGRDVQSLCSQRVVLHNVLL
jgi:hypothetical protein